MPGAPAICVPVQTRIGLEPPPVSDLGVYESWCDGFPGPRWAESPFNGDTEIETACASFGGALLFRADPELMGQSVLMFHSDRLDLSGMTVTVTLAPPETLDWFWFQADHPDNIPLGGAMPNPAAWFEVTGSGQMWMQINVGEEFESALIPYDPEDHHFLQMRHDQEEGILQLRTAGFCKDWETQVEAAVGSEWQSQRLGFRMDTDGADPQPDFGRLGQVLITPTAVELEDPEEEEEENGNGNGD